jgi:hypothetical protein
MTKDPWKVAAAEAIVPVIYQAFDKEKTRLDQQYTVVVI